MKKNFKVSVPGANDWIKQVLIPRDNPHKLMIIVRAANQRDLRRNPTHRQLRAALFMLAAECELRCPKEFTGVVCVGDVSHYGNGEIAMTLFIATGADSMEEFYTAEGVIQDVAVDLERAVLRLL